MDKTNKGSGFTASNREVPKGIFILLILLYGISAIISAAASRNPGAVIIFNTPVPFTAFSGVSSTFGNGCMILLVIMFGKLGFYTSMGILLCQFPILASTIFIRHNTGSFPGLFINLLTMITLVIIYLNQKKLNKYQQKIHEQAVTDRLTGLPNRFACNEFLQDLVKHPGQFAIVSADINDFKSINDTMGHDTGDEVLRIVADRWTGLAQSLHNRLNVFVARLSADEFMLVIRGYNRSSDVESIIRDFENELEKKMTIDDCDYFITASFGFAEYPKDDNNVDSLFLFADSALHEAKRLGTTSILRFRADILNTEFFVETERKIRTALDEDRVFCHLQPQYDINHNLRGFESLARIREPDGTMLSPSDFIPVAEKTGLIDSIDMRVFTLAMEFLSDALRARPDSPVIISVNVSVKHLMRNNYIDDIKKIISRYNVPADHIEIEITESIMVDSLDKALERIGDIKAMGMKLAIDDFGTGYSSLSYLNNFPSDLLKIDKSFIDLMNSSESSKKYVAAIVSIGHVLNLNVISEGVEDESQIETLRKIGCDYIQGFVWGRPMPVDEALKLVIQ